MQGNVPEIRVIMEKKILRNRCMYNVQLQYVRQKSERCIRSKCTQLHSCWLRDLSLHLMNVPGEWRWGGCCECFSEGVFWEGKAFFLTILCVLILLGTTLYSQHSPKGLRSAFIATEEITECSVIFSLVWFLNLLRLCSERKLCLSWVVQA